MSKTIYANLKQVPRAARLRKSKLLAIIYLLPLCYLAVGILLVPIETTYTGSFAESCRDERSPYRFYDFCLYYAGGKIAASPDRAGFYQADVQHKYLRLVRDTDPLPHSLVMQYAPFVPAVAAIPALLTGQLAYDLYVLISAVCFTASFYLLFKLRQGYALWQKVGIALAAAGSVPFFVTTLLGQMSCLLLFLTVAYFYCLKTNRPKLAGLALALSSFKPHYAVFWLIPAVVQRRTKLLITAALVEAVLIGLACMSLGIEAVLSYPAAVLRADNIAECAQVAILMVSLRGLLIAASMTGAAFSVALPAMLLATALVAAAWHRLAKNDLESTLISATVIACLFFSPHSYIYDALLLTIPILLVDIKDPDIKSKILLKLLIATPYLQWLGMMFLPIKYHRSLPTALILLMLAILISWQIIATQIPARCTSQKEEPPDR